MKVFLLFYSTSNCLRHNAHYSISEYHSCRAACDGNTWV